jgi:hypothetical protein
MESLQIDEYESQKLERSSIEFRVDGNDPRRSMSEGSAHTCIRTESNDLPTRTTTRRLGSCEIPASRASKVDPPDLHSSRTFPSSPLLHLTEPHQCGAIAGPAAACHCNSGGGGEGGWLDPVQVGVSCGCGVDSRGECSPCLMDPQAAAAAARPDRPFHSSSLAPTSGAPPPPQPPQANDPFHGDWPHW